jgi:cell fate regulator YaaT (PSP1 superfamily)
MADAVGIRFRPCGKIYDFEVNGTPVKKGDLVVVESELGLSIGTVVVDRHEIDGKELKKVIRLATEEDIKQKEENDKLSEEYRAFCLERIMARGLPMKLIRAEATLDRKRIIFYFVSEGRVDFRELVKDLAARYKTRIEMRQIGVRDETKMIGGIGICGREVCCRTFLTSFEPISIKMIKDQEIVLNTSKLSGLCGRLMCCLGYEYEETEESGTQDDMVETDTGSDMDVVHDEAGDLDHEVAVFETQGHENGPALQETGHSEDSRKEEASHDSSTPESPHSMEVSQLPDKIRTGENRPGHDFKRKKRRRFRR